MAHDIFISHSTKDKAVADAVCASLEATGVRCWIAPRDIRAGERWATSILRGIADSRVMVLVFSEHANASEHIQREVERAAHRGIPIAPLRISGSSPKDDLEYFLSSSHWMEAHAPPSETELSRFAQQVCDLLKIGGPPAAEPAIHAEQQVPAMSPRRRRPGLLLLTASIVAVGLAAGGWIFRGRLPGMRSADSTIRNATGSQLGMLKDLFIAERISDEQFKLGNTLLKADPRSLGQYDTARRDQFLVLLDGKLSPDKLAAALSAIEIPRGDLSGKSFTNTIGMKFVRIEAGEFLMGSPVGEPNRLESEAQHPAQIASPFFMGAFHVTRGQFAAFIKASGYTTDAEKAGQSILWKPPGHMDIVKGAYWQNPGFDQGNDHPVVIISWYDSVAFCEWLSNREGVHYRLPTQMEWEYACRAGTHTAYPWGDDPNEGKGWANVADQTYEASFPKDPPYFNFTDDFVYTSPVGTFRPNNFGLYDMIGNAWQWCSDDCGIDPTIDRVNPARAARGGAWANHLMDCRAGYIHQIPARTSWNTTGFRVCLEIPK